MPLRPTSWALSEMPPDAWATLGSDRTWVSSDSGSDGVEGSLPPLSLLLIALLPLTTASEFLLACVNTVENAD